MRSCSATSGSRRSPSRSSPRSPACARTAICAPCASRSTCRTSSSSSTRSTSAAPTRPPAQAKLIGLLGHSLGLQAKHELDTLPGWRWRSVWIADRIVHRLPHLLPCFDARAARALVERLVDPISMRRRHCGQRLEDETRCRTRSSGATRRTSSFRFARLEAAIVPEPSIQALVLRRRAGAPGGLGVRRRELWGRPAKHAEELEDHLEGLLLARVVRVRARQAALDRVGTLRGRIALDAEQVDRLF